MNYIFIDSKEELDIVGIVEDNRLAEFYQEKTKAQSILGNIYRARVANTLQGMEAGFVDIGQEKNAYIPLKEALKKEQMYTGEKYSLEEVIKGGQEVIVQVIKEPVGNKGAKVTTHLTITGRYLVITPYSHNINISKKIVDPDEVMRLKSIGRRIKSDDIGMIIRTNSAGIDESQFQEEYDSLVAIYKKIESERNFLPTPKLVYKDSGLIYQIIRDCFTDMGTKIIVNNKEKYENIMLLDDYFSNKLKDKIAYDPTFSIDDDMRIQMDIKEALSRTVQLENGGYIVIDETEALTAIDVNTGKYVGGLSLKDTVLSMNLEAAEEIARQIRLRDIGGIIIIDFIDMKDKSHIPMVLEKLREEFTKDRNKPNVIDMTKLCLVEVTRKRTRATLDSISSAECPTCNGKGRIRKY